MTENDVDNFVSLAIRTANGGMIAAGIDFEPILGSHRSRQDVHDWLEAGIPQELIIEVIASKAKEAAKQISSMKYFTKAVLQAYEKKQAHIPEGSQAAEIAKEGIAGNYHQSNTKSSGTLRHAGTDEELMSQDEADRRRVAGWRKENTAEAARIWEEVRQEAIERNIGVLGQAAVDGYLETRFCRRVVNEILTPKAVA